MAHETSVQVAFIGAGPGDAELLTLKAARLIAQADLVLYAGSLVPREVVSHARPGAEVRDSAPMTLEETHACIMRAVRTGGRVARVHTGDPSLYGAIREQMALLDAEGVAYEIVPGVSAAFDAAARAAVSLTVPGAAQSLVFTRVEGKTPMPEAQSLRAFAATGASLAVYLSAAEPEKVREELLAGGLAPETPVVVAHKIGWPGGSITHTDIAGIPGAVKALGAARQVLFLVLPGELAGQARSRLYDGDHAHCFRRGCDLPPAK